MPCTRIVRRMTTEVTNTIRSRSGNGAPPATVDGTASAAASDTAPRKPAHPLTMRCRHPTRRVRCTARRSTARMTKGVRSTQSSRVPITTTVIARATPSARCVLVPSRPSTARAELHPDQHPQAAVDQERGEVPEREGQRAGPRADHAWARVGQHEPGHDHGHHAAGVHELGEQERHERGQHAERSFAQRVVQAAPDEHDQRAGQQPGADAAGVGAQEAARQPERSRPTAVDRRGDGDREQHQRRPVVDEALGAQRRQRAPGQPFRQSGDRRRVGRRQHRAQHPRRPALHAQCLGRPRHRRHRDDDEHDAGQDDHPQVRADLAQARVQALPVEDRGQEQQQDDVGIELDVGQPGDETEQASRAQQQHRRRDAVAPSQRRPDQHGDAEHDDDHEAQHVGTVPTATPPRRPPAVWPAPRRPRLRRPLPAPDIRAVGRSAAVSAASGT